MLQLIISAVYFMIPAYCANMTPVLVRKVPFLNYPVDFNRLIKGKPIFGKNKTFRGFFFGMIVSTLIAYLQYIIPYKPQIIYLDYSVWPIIGILMGFGALFGDLIESFIKRRLSLSPGRRFVPWDQTDFVIGALLLISFISIPPISLIITCLLLSFVLHIAVNHIAYFAGIRKGKW